MKSLSEILAEGREAALHGDAGPAYRTLTELLKIQAQNPGSSMPPEVSQLLIQLRYTAFPELPQADAQDILRGEVIKMLRAGVDLEERLSIRGVFVGYDRQEQDRRELQKAILANQEMVGPQSISNWIREYDKAYAPDSREERALQDFMTNNPKVKSLSGQEFAILKIVLLAYDRWLSGEVLNIFDLAVMKNNLESGGVVGIGSAPSSKAGGSVERIPLLQAMGKYPRLGDQTITTNRIKIKSSPEPARGSLSNWIHYYRDELGVGFHDEVLRGKFLFQSENGRKLSSVEREHLNLILKSIEEDFPLEIDTAHQTIIFPPTEVKSMELGSQGTTRQPMPLRSVPAQPVQSKMPNLGMNKPPIASPAFIKPASASPKSFFAEKRESPEKNIAGNTLHFSTGHVMPAESANRQSPPSAPAVSTPPAPKPFTPPSGGQEGIQRKGGVTPGQNVRSPYSIRPLRPKTDR